jgi:hypothetical protein
MRVIELTPAPAEMGLWGKGASKTRLRQPVALEEAF